MRILPILLASLFLFPILSSAQIQTMWKSGSVYSYVGYGLPNDYKGDFTSAMGISGVAMHDIRHSNIANPALWGHASFSNISGGLSLKSHQVSDAEGTNWNNSIMPGQVQGVFPVKRNQFGISFSLTPITQSSFNVSYLSELSADDINFDSDLLYEENKEGFGGLHALEAGFGWRVTDYISVGYAPSFVFGTHRIESRVFFDNPNFQSSGYTSYTYSKGFRNRFGVFSSLPGFGESSSRLNIGLTATLPINLSVEREIEGNIASREFPIADKSNFDLQGKLPLEATFGFAYQFNNHTTFSSDVLYQDWASSEFIDAHQSFEVTSRIKAGAGLQINASRMSGEPTLATRFNYRFGASYDTGYLRVNNTQVSTFLMSAGLGIPSHRSGSSININFEFGFRGDEINTFASETIYGINLSLSLSELMFIRSRIQ